MINANLNRPTLFQYLDNQQAGIDDLNAIAEKQKESSTENLQAVEASLSSLRSIDQLIDDINSGESKVTQETIQDMQDFYARQVTDEIQETAKQYGLTELPGFASEGNKWQLITEEALSNAQQQFIEYINKDTRLGKRLERVASLSELNELALSRQYAATLKTEDTSGENIENYLLETRELVNDNKGFSMQDGELRLHNIGLAKHVFERTSEQ